MATLWISEAAELKTDSGGQELPLFPEPAIATQVVTFTGTAGQSAAFRGETRIVRLYASAACYVAFGADPTAVTAVSEPLSATTEYFRRVEAGQKVSAVS